MCVSNADTRTSALTCMVEDTLERDRPSRSDSRLEERKAGFGALVGAGVTKVKRKM